MNNLGMFTIELVENFLRNVAHEGVVMMLEKLKAAGLLDKLKAALAAVEQADCQPMAEPQPMVDAEPEVPAPVEVL